MWILCRSHRMHKWDLKTVTSVFNRDVRTFYMRYMSIDLQDTQENVELSTNSFCMFLHSSSVLVVLTHLFMESISRFVGTWSSGQEEVDIGCGAWTEIASCISQPWVIGARHEP